MTIDSAEVHANQWRIGPASLGHADVAPTPESVAIVTINRSQGTTGVHTHTTALRDGLRAEGVQCNVVTAFDNPAPWLAVFAVRPLLLDRFWPAQSIHWYRYWHGVTLKRSLRNYLSEHAVNHLIAQCPVSAQAAMDVRRELGLLASLRVTMVCHFNYSEASEYRELGQLNDEDAYARMLRFEDRVLSDVDQVIYVSEWARDIVEKDRRIAPRASAVIHNGLQSLSGNEPFLSRGDIGVAVDDLVLINVGSLERRKDQLGLLSLFASLHPRVPRAKLVLVGDGPDRDAIEQRAISLGLSDRIVLLGRRADVPSILKLADLYVHYSVTENCPMAILEAARAGLPWAAIPASGVAELQRLIGGCIAIDPADLEGASSSISRLLNDPPTRKLLGEFAHEQFAHRFTRSLMVRSYLRQLQCCAGGAR